MGDMLLTSVPEGWESNPHKNQVVQPTSYALVVWLPIPLRSRTLRKFQTNGSQATFEPRDVASLQPHRSHIHRQGRPKCSLPLWQREEVQEVLRPVDERTIDARILWWSAQDMITPPRVCDRSRYLWGIQQVPAFTFLPATPLSLLTRVSTGNTSRDSLLLTMLLLWHRVDYGAQIGCKVALPQQNAAKTERLRNGSAGGSLEFG